MSHPFAICWSIKLTAFYTVTFCNTVTFVCYLLKHKTHCIDAVTAIDTVTSFCRLFKHFIHVTFIYFIVLDLSYATDDLHMTGLRSELRFIWKKKLINAFTASVWLFAHRLLTYAVVLLLVVFGGTLRASPLYIAVSFMFLVAYNGIGCVFEGVSKLSEVLVAATRIQVRSTDRDYGFFAFLFVCLLVVVVMV